MIVLLDATVIGSDLGCSSAAWQVLALATPGWGVKVAVTEVVVAEAVALYQRKIEAAHIGLERWAEKHLAAIGLPEARSAAESVLSDAASAYADRLRANLKASHVDLLAVTDMPHMVLVRRATDRRRPCNDKGDGYRDTLNWLTLLALAKSQPEEQIVWVSDNTGDFGADDQDDESAFHPHLIEDLESISAREVVSWKRTLADAVLGLAAEYAPGSEADLKRVKEKVRDASVLTFLTTELLPSAIQQPLSPRLCALPSETQSAVLVSAERARNLKLDVKGVVSGSAVAEFTIEVDAGIDATMVFANTSGSVHSGVGGELRFRVPVQRAGRGSQGSPARARVMASRAVRPWFAAESR